jgi:hypothetical protein
MHDGENGSGKGQGMDASVEGGLKDDGLSGQIGVLEYVESADVLLTKPVEIYVQYESGYRHWVASFCPAAISAAGESPREAIEELRRLLVFISERRITARDLPEPWAWLSPKLLGTLDDHFARKSVDA